MAKGAVAKKEIFEKMLEVFEGSFIYNNGKELRINYEEESGPVQIKVTLTAAKEAVTPMGAAVENAAATSETATSNNFPKPKELIEPSDEEKRNVEELLNALGLN